MQILDLYLKRILIDTKKHIAAFLLTLFLLHSGFQFLIFKVFEAKYKSEIKEMIEEGIPDENLVKFSFPQRTDLKRISGFTWKKKNEFRFDGEMYDIVKRVETADSIHLYCIHDKKESRLFASLEKYICAFIEKNPGKQNDLNSIAFQLSKLYAVSTIDLLSGLYPYLNKFQVRTDPEPFEAFLTPPTPPPKNIL